MRFFRFILLSCLQLLNVSVWAKQAATPEQTALPQPVRDPQALSLLNQALSVAGGAAAITANLTTPGLEILHTTRSERPGNSNGRGLRSTEFRMDSNLPAGIRSWAVTDGEIASKSETELFREWRL